MNHIPLNSLPRFIKGVLTKRDGELFLKTRNGVTPVKLEGSTIPLGKEVIFKFLRQEPGKLILTPLSRWEVMEESLPFLKDLPSEDREAWKGYIKAAVKEGLPLDKDVLLSIRKWSLVAEKEWGVKVNPRVFAFLLAKEIPVKPATVLWALYARFPSVQKEIWKQAIPGLLNVLSHSGANAAGESFFSILRMLPEILQLIKNNPAGDTKTPLPSEANTGQSNIAKVLVESGIVKESGEPAGKQGNTGVSQVSPDNTAAAQKTDGSPNNIWTDILKEVSRFAAGQSRTDSTLPELTFFLFPKEGKEIKWEGQAVRGEGKEKGYSFRLTYYSRSMQEMEIIGAQVDGGLELAFGLKNREDFLPYVPDIKKALQSKGWRIKRLRLFGLNGKSEDKKELPPSIDGWV